MMTKSLGKTGKNRRLHKSSERTFCSLESMRIHSYCNLVSQQGKQAIDMVIPTEHTHITPAIVYMHSSTCMKYCSRETDAILLACMRRHASFQLKPQGLSEHYVLLHSDSYSNALQRARLAKLQPAAFVSIFFCLS